MLDDVFEAAVRFLGYWFYHLFIEFFCFYTGEVALYIITFGKRKPRWDYYAHDKPTKFVVLTELSVWIGMFFWVLIIALFVKFSFSI